MEARPTETAPGPWAWTGALVLAAALLSLPWRGHVDDVDAQLYQVVARHVAAGLGWLDLRYLPGAYDHFREHLPFGFWPAAAAIRWFGEGALGPVSALFTLGTLGLVAWAAARLAGPWAGLSALLLLATCESTWRYGGRFWLDPPLVFFATASAVPVLLPRTRPAHWVAAAALAGLAALVKGPFGLLPLPCAALAAAVAYREPRRLAWGALATVGGALPVVAFLWGERRFGDSTWWTGYVVTQLSASATGRRTDGRLIWWYPFQVVAGRFWPGLPFAALAAWRGLREKGEGGRTERLLSLFALALLVGLCLPRRKWWNHELVAFPPLALLAGAGAAPLATRWLGGSGTRARRTAVALVAAAAVACVASAAGLGRWLLLPPCVGSTEFAAALDPLPAGSPVLVVAPTTDWLTLATLSAERRLSPWPVTGLPQAAREPGSAVAGARLALVREGEPVPAPWRERSRARGWVLAERP